MRRKTGKSDGKTDKPRGDRRSGQNNRNRQANNGSEQTQQHGATPGQLGPKRAFKSYPELLKIQACVAALTVNPEHPTSTPALEAARAVLNAPIYGSTLGDWLNQYKGEITALMPVTNRAQLIQETQQAILAEWSRVENMALKAINQEKLDKSAGRDLAVIAGISRTHLSKMISLDAEMINSVVRFQNLCQRLGVDSKTMLDDYSTVLERRALPPVSVNSENVAIEPRNDPTD